MIDAVGVVVPAHNEEARIGACLDSVRRALHRLPDRIDRAVVLVLDRCTDRTDQVVARRMRGWPEARVVTVHHRAPGSGVGLLRDIGVRNVLHDLSATAGDRTWLLSTDADTLVPPDWALRHLRYAAAGAHGVAGLADLREEAHLDEGALARYWGIVSAGVHGGTHSHVYAANVGVRADAYLVSGGFPARDHGEEHHLWRALTEAGYRTHQPTDVRVSTSARTDGRAPGGVADLLRSLRLDQTPVLAARSTG